MSARPVTGILAVTLLVSFAHGGEQEPGFSHLDVEDGILITGHRLAYSFEAAETFRRVGPTHRQAVFSGVPFEVSLAAFIREDGAVMVHAERVADGSGASDYTRLPEADWPDGRFRLKPPECLDLPPDAIDGEHDLEWLRDNGFPVAGTLHLQQYFASTADFNEELVISFLVRVESCADEAANKKALETLRSGIAVARTD